MQPSIIVEGLEKYYGTLHAVRGVSFSVPSGSLFSFLGPNGAGKSTTIDMLATLLRPSTGKVIVEGHELGRQDDAIRSTIGVVFQQGVLDQLLTVRENLRVRASFYNLHGKSADTAVEKAAQSAGTEFFMDQRYGKLSGGQRRRADIARALLHVPRLLILDEPTTGLDPQNRAQVWQTVRHLQHTEGMTVFMTTHYMQEAAYADEVAIIDEGRIVAQGTPLRLQEQYARDRLYLEPTDPAAIGEILTARGLDYSVEGERLAVQFDQSMDALPILDAARAHVKSFELIHGSMEDVFLNITGKNIREDLA